jgi:hypothetical protein
MKSLPDICQQLRPGPLCFGNAFWSSIDQFERFGAVYQFRWKYTEMRLLRKQLMLQMLKWGSS